MQLIAAQRAGRSSFQLGRFPSDIHALPILHNTPPPEVRCRMAGLELRAPGASAMSCVREAPTTRSTRGAGSPSQRRRRLRACRANRAGPWERCRACARGSTRPLSRPPRPGCGSLCAVYKLRLCSATRCGPSCHPATGLRSACGQGTRLRKAANATHSPSAPRQAGADVDHSREVGGVASAEHRPI